MTSAMKVGRSLLAAIIMVFIVALVALSISNVAALSTSDTVLISEVYYDPPGTESDNEFIELYNPGPGTAYLDGAIITDEGTTTGTEGVFQFPGSPGETNYPITAGEFVVIMVDAVDDGNPPEAADADWEFYSGGSDSDNLSVPNLTRVSGSEIILANGGDGIILATGTGTTTPIDQATIVDGMNYGSPDDPVPADTNTADTAYHSGTTEGNSLQRGSDFADTNNSATDFDSASPTPGASIPTAITLSSFAARSPTSQATFFPWQWLALAGAVVAFGGVAVARGSLRR